MSCKGFTEGSIFDTVLAAGLAVGIFLSYIPQHIMILRRRTIEGISPVFLLLMNIGAGLMLGNMVLESAPIFRCCPDLGLWQCLSSLLGLVQIVAAFFGPTVILLLCVLYMEPETLEYREIYSVFRVSLAANTTIAVIVCLGFGQTWSRTAANTFGSVSAVLGTIQYFPQLLTTHRLKHTGSLSKLTLMIQIPGGYLWCLSLAMRDGSVWSTWITIFITASLQLILLLMLVCYSVVNTQHVVAVISSPATPVRQNNRPEGGDYHD